MLNEGWSCHQYLVERYYRRYRGCLLLHPLKWPEQTEKLGGLQSQSPEAATSSESILFVYSINKNWECINDPLICSNFYAGEMLPYSDGDDAILGQLIASASRT